MGVQEEDIPKRLYAAADELIKLRTENEMLRRGPPALAAIAEEVQALIDNGGIDTTWRIGARTRSGTNTADRSSRYEAWFSSRGARRRPAACLSIGGLGILPKPQFSLRRSTRGSNGVSCSVRHANSISRGRNSGTMPHWPKRLISIVIASLSFPLWSAARLGHDPEQSRHCACNARRARERHGAARGGGCRLSRGAEGTDPRARAARLGHDPEQSRHCASERSASARAARRGSKRRSPPIARR